MDRFKTNRFFLLNYSLLAGIVLFIYFTSPLRNEVEKRFYVVKTIISSYFGAPQDVVVVTVDPNSGRKSTSPQTDLSYEELLRLVKKVSANQPASVTALLHSQVFPLDRPSRKKLTNFVRGKKNIYLGVFDFEKNDLDEESISAESRIFNASTGYFYKEQMVVQLPYENTTTLTRAQYLLPAIVKEHAPQKFQDFTQAQQGAKSVEGLKYFRLRYYQPARIQKVSMEEVLTKPIDEMFVGKHVIIGYTAFRKYDFRINEATYVNTPLKMSEGSVQEGEPLVYVMALGLSSLLTSEYIEPVAVVWNVLQVLCTCLLAWFVWALPVQLVLLSFIAFILLLLGLHASLLTFLSVNFITADSVMFGLIVTFSASLRRTQKEMNKRLYEQEVVQAKTEVLDVQEAFLKDLSIHLSQASEEVSELLTKHESTFSSDATMSEVYSNAYDSTQEFKEYLNGIRQFLKVNRHSVKVSFKSFDAKEAIQAILARFSTRIHVKQQNIVLNVDSLPIKSDPVLFDQIFHNLISNAVKYSPPSSTVEVSCDKKDGVVTFKVADEGPGIPPDEREKVFEKFYRIKDDNVYKVKGSGLGLYLSQYFARLIKAELSIEESRSGGACFVLKVTGKK